MLQVMKLGFCFSPPTVTLFALLSNSVLSLFIIPQQNLAYLTKSFLYFSPVFWGEFLFVFIAVRILKSLIYSTVPILVQLTVIIFRIFSYITLFLLNTFSMGNVIFSHGFNYQLFPIICIMV